MRIFPKILATLGIIAAVVAAGIWFGWLGTRGGENRSQPSVSVASAPLPVKSNHLTLFQKRPRTHSPRISTNQSPTAASTNLITDWEDRLDQILQAETEDA